MKVIRGADGLTSVQWVISPKVLKGIRVGDLPKQKVEGRRYILISHYFSFIWVVGEAATLKGWDFILWYNTNKIMTVFTEKVNPSLVTRNLRTARTSGNRRLRGDTMISPIKLATAKETWTTNLLTFRSPRWVRWSLHLVFVDICDYRAKS